MASQIAEGALKAGVNVVLRKVENCTKDDLASADGLVVGSPTHYSNIAWQIKRFMDETVWLSTQRGTRSETKCAAASHPQEHTPMEKSASECWNWHLELP